MTASLAAKTCIPCKGGVPPLTSPQARELLAQAAGWQLAGDDTRIEKAFGFANFKDSLDFAGQVGDLAESEFHHPVSITFGWGFCAIVLQTKKIKGLHENDFIMAAKINALAGA